MADLGQTPLGAWFLALSAFTVFTAVSFYQGWVGQTSCGCFGRVTLSPWYALSIDLAAVTALLLGRPDLQLFRTNPRSVAQETLVPIACGFGGIFLLSALLLGLAAAGFGSVTAAVAHFRGERISVQPHLIDAGEGSSGEDRSVAVELTNWTDKPVRLIGGTADCSCTVLYDLPATIRPKESHSIMVRVRMSGKPGIFMRNVSFLVDDEGFKRLHFRMTGRITDATNGER